MSEKKIPTASLSAQTLIDMIGISSEISVAHIENISDYVDELRFQRLSNSSRDNLIREVLKRIELDTQIIGAAERKGVWERGWAEVLVQYDNADPTDAVEKELIPKFFRANQSIRLLGNYAAPLVSNFESIFVSALRSVIFDHYFCDVTEFHEFGAGTGHNLVHFCKKFPQIQAFGSDFVHSSVTLMNRLSHDLNLNLTSTTFDMTRPADDYEIGEGAGVFTFGSIEQLAGKYHRFIDFILSKKIKLCVHIEPVIELYNESLLFDWLAIKFQSKRGYTAGFLPYLQQLESSGRVTLSKVKRLGFGSLMMEGYNLIVWRPV